MLNKSKGENIYAQVNLLFVDLDRELQEQTGEQFAKYKATVEKEKRSPYGKLGSAISRRQFNSENLEMYSSLNQQESLHGDAMLPGLSLVKPSIQ